jgi:hypothetical protein
VLAALCAAFALAALPAEAQAFDLTISTDPTTNVTEAPPTPILGAPTTFTATADPAVLNTSHAGAFTYSVVAVSKDGQATVTQIRYVVLFPSDQLGRPQVRSNRDG